MTDKEAKELTLEMWRYLRDHPKIKSKKDLPTELWEKVRDLSFFCPLCELYNKECDYTVRCSGCPLDYVWNNCNQRGSAYEAWICAEFNEDSRRHEAAREIVNIVRKWKV